MKTLAVVTGASKNFGRAICEELAKKVENVDFHIFARTLEGLQSTEKLIKQIRPSSTVDIFVADFSDLHTLENIWKQSMSAIEPSHYNKIWLINNHGSLGVMDYVSDIRDYQQVSDDITMNVTSLFVTSSLFLTKLKDCKDKEVSLVNVSSGAALRPLNTWGVYCSGKAARHMLTQVISEEIQDKPHIKTFSYSPGPLKDTDMQHTIRTQCVDEGVKQTFTRFHENNQLIDTNFSAGKMVDILTRNTYKSGGHYDFKVDV